MNMPNDDYWVNLSEKDADFRKARAHVVMRVDGKYSVLVFAKFMPGGLGEPPRRVVFDTRADAYRAVEQLNVDDETAQTVEQSIRGFS